MSGPWFDVFDHRGRWLVSFNRCDDAWCYACYALTRRGTVQQRLGL